MKILLLSFQDDTDTIGLKYLHSYLSKNQIDSSILFIPKHDEEGINSVIKFLKDFKPDIIGVSLLSQEFHTAKKFSIAIKEQISEITITWGGLHASIATKECLNYADYVFIGESEESFLEFIHSTSENKPVTTIPNLAYKSENGININKLRPLNESLDNSPFPEHLPKKSFILHNREVVKLSEPLFRRYANYGGKVYYLITSRGCPFSCSYCCNSFFSKLYGINKIRTRSVQNIIEELKHVIEQFPKLEYISIQDDNFFSHNLEWMKDFSDNYKKEIKKNFISRTTPIHLTEEKISLLKDAGLSWIFMGLQSGSKRINHEIYKRFASNEKFIEASKIVKHYHLAGYYDIILDNPYETEQDILETIKVILKAPKPYMLQLFSLCFYQGTEIYDRSLKENLKIENPRKKNYYKFKQTYLNKVIRLCPLLPKRFNEFMVKNRNSRWAKILMNIIYLPSSLILEPLVSAWLVFISFDHNIPSTLSFLFSSFKFGIYEKILKK